MATLPCPTCSAEILIEDEPVDTCPECRRPLVVAYRYRLVAARGEIAGGRLYEGRDDGLATRVAVLFAAKPDDREALRRFVDGNRLFADLGGRGLVRIHEVGSEQERPPYVVMDWLDGGTLDGRVSKHGALELAEVDALFSNLLSGLARAHRAMPAVIHGHIHPGKVGFVGAKDGGPGYAVLFGFEWARQVFEQDSHLADAFVESEGEPSKVNSTTDLRQLAHTVYYAATGEWIADRKLSDQRSRARAGVPGPLGHALERMLVAGGDEGYRSAVEARLDLDRLRGGDSGWRPRGRPSDDMVVEGDAKGWSGGGDAYYEGSAKGWSGGGDAYYERDRPFEADAEAIEELDDDDYSFSDDGDEELPAGLNEIFEARASSARAPSRAPSFPQASTHVPPIQPQKPPANPARLLFIVMGVIFAFGTCVAGVVMDASDDFDEPAPPAEIAIEPIPPEAYEPPPLPPTPEELTPPPTPTASFDQTIRYLGLVTGPEGREQPPTVGTGCAVWAEPQRGSFNCRWYVDCGGVRYYGGGTVGFTKCEVSGGKPTQASDGRDDDGDGAFFFVSTDEGAQVRVLDSRAIPPVVLEIELDAGVPASDPIPEVAQLKRAEDEDEAEDEAPTPEEAVEEAQAGATQAELEAEAALAEAEAALAELDAGPAPKTLDAEQLLAGLNGSKGALLKCDVPSNTQLKLTVTVGRDGKVSEVEVRPPQGEAVDSCIVDAMATARFPRFTGEPISVVWPVRW